LSQVFIITWDSIKEKGCEDIKMHPDSTFMSVTTGTRDKGVGTRAEVAGGLWLVASEEVECYAKRNEGPVGEKETGFRIRASGFGKKRADSLQQTVDSEEVLCAMWERKTVAGDQWKSCPPICLINQLPIQRITAA